MDPAVLDPGATANQTVSSETAMREGVGVLWGLQNCWNPRRSEFHVLDWTSGLRPPSSAYALCTPIVPTDATLEKWETASQTTPFCRYSATPRKLTSRKRTSSSNSSSATFDGGSSVLRSGSVSDLARGAGSIRVSSAAPSWAAAVVGIAPAAIPRSQSKPK